MSKMGSHDPFGHLKHKLWPKKRPRVKMTIWFPITKSQESLRFPCIQACATYCWKALHEGYNFASNLISIKGLHAKLWALKVAIILVVRISGLPFGHPGTKWHLGVDSMARHKIYYKGEDGGFPQIRAMVSLVNLCLPVVRSCTKVLQLCTNQLVV
jgi:hypothetical protein